MFVLSGAQRRRFTVRQQGKIQQTMGVVVGWTQQLPAGNILVDRGDSALKTHFCAVNRFADSYLCQRSAVGAEQKDGLDVIAAGLFERQCSQFAVSDATFGHHPINGQVHLLFDLRHAQFSNGLIAPASVFLQGVGVGYRLFAPFDGDVHQHTSTWVVRGIASRRSPQVRIRSTPSGNGCGRSVSS